MNNHQKLLDINKNGFLKDKLIIDEKFEDFANFVKSYALIKDSKRERSGYSNDIYDDLPIESKNYVKNLALEILKKNEWIKKYINLPRLLNIQVLKTGFDENASDNPTHAMLWHRDTDDLYHHLKVQIPLHKIKKENGIFSCAKKTICSINHKLVDKKLYEKSMKEEDDYKASDKIRVSDQVMYNHFNDKILDFECDISDILFVDTNYCYHRGGLILEPGLTRNLITITYGGITHELNDYFKDKVFNKKNFIKKFVARSLRFSRKKLLEFKGGVRHIPIVLD